MMQFVKEIVQYMCELLAVFCAFLAEIFVLYLCLLANYYR